MSSYQPAVKVGEHVRIVSRKSLEKFAKTWRHHNPLTSAQLAFAGQTARVRNVGIYHGGDVIYELEGIGGTWHEICLVATDER
jgi:hypothetical protein